MARIRSIKPEFFTSLTIGQLHAFVRLTFIGLWTYADDDGRAVDDARLIRAAVWPLDDRTIAEVEADLDTLAHAGLIRRYEVDGRRYLVVTHWDEHQKVSHPKASRYPAPPQRDTPPPAILRKSSGNPPEDSGAAPPRAGAEQGAGSREQGAGNGTPSGVAREARAHETDGSDGEPAPKRQRRRSPLTARPPDWTPSDRHAKHATELLLDVEAEAEAFRDHHDAKGNTFTDWDKAFHTWLRKAHQFRGSPTSGSGNGQGSTWRGKREYGNYGLPPLVIDD